MKETKEIKALLQLIDDPDVEVYKSVEEKIFSYGSEIIPTLENYWISLESADTQERINDLINRLQFKEIEDGFYEWKNDPADLLEAVLLISKLQYPGIDTTEIKLQVEKVRKSIWLELNNYLTPLEQANVFNAIILHVNKFKGVELSYESPDHFLLNKVFESKTGNAIGFGILYLVLAQMLDTPIKAVNIPRQFVLAYFDEQYHFFNPKGAVKDAIKFYLFPLNGQFFSQRDIEEYLKKLGKEASPAYFKPMSNIEIIKFYLKEISKCFQNDSGYRQYDALQAILELLSAD